MPWVLSLDFNPIRSTIQLHLDLKAWSMLIGGWETFIKTPSPFEGSSFQLQLFQPLLVPKLRAPSNGLLHVLRSTTMRCHGRPYQREEVHKTRGRMDTTEQSRDRLCGQQCFEQTLNCKCKSSLPNVRIIWPSRKQQGRACEAKLRLAKSMMLWRTGS